MTTSILDLITSGRLAVAVALTWLCAGVYAGPTTGIAPASKVDRNVVKVSFADCSELASITRITVARARTIVPTSFILGGDASGAPLVVRVAHCGAVTVDTGAPEAGTVAQVGVSILSPDGTGDINNYLAWYYTTSHRLAERLERSGIAAQWVPHLGYDLTPNPAHPDGALGIDVAGQPAFRVGAAVVEPVLDPVQFTANWWSQSGSRLTKMSTPIPALRFGAATATLRTAASSGLGRVIGAPSTTFAVLDTFNRFAAAPMTVSTTRPRDNRGARAGHLPTPGAPTAKKGQLSSAHSPGLDHQSTGATRW